ncbi:MAG TPA: CDGSH iron-sulfur domain-containing protein [Candidatus Thermoplasmatota archaeon]|nr:CDGSH iron-sulfur domain-containing protein [Candidatus Thermoplasmatota archaeon]
MTRIVSHSANGPMAVPKASTPGEAIYVCRCGLSASPLGLCDGSHKATRDEQPGQVYLYERRDGQLVRVGTQVGVATVAPPTLETLGGAN